MLFCFAPSSSVILILPGLFFSADAVQILSEPGTTRYFSLFGNNTGQGLVSEVFWVSQLSSVSPNQGLILRQGPYLRGKQLLGPYLPSYDGYQFH